MSTSTFSAARRGRLVIGRREWFFFSVFFRIVPVFYYYYLLFLGGRRVGDGLSLHFKVMQLLQSMIYIYTMNCVQLAFWLVKRNVWLEYRRTIDVIEWCDRRTWSESRVQPERLVNKVLQIVFASSGQTQANFLRKGKVSNKKLDKDGWEWPQPG